MTQKFEMADRFNPSAVEQALYQHWEESGYIKPSENEHAPNYCIAIPTPPYGKRAQTMRVLRPNWWWNV